MCWKVIILKNDFNNNKQEISDQKDEKSDNFNKTDLLKTKFKTKQMIIKFNYILTNLLFKLFSLNEDLIKSKLSVFYTSNNTIFVN